MTLRERIADVATYFVPTYLGISAAELLVILATGDEFDFRAVFDAAFFMTAGAIAYRWAK